MHLNSGFYKDLDTNFKCACDMLEKDFSHAELLDMLKNGNIPQKQISAMKIGMVNEDEADALIANLTGCDGKIREAVALKINQLLNSDEKYIGIFSKYYLTFAQASIDINGNICKLVIDSAAILKNDKNFCEKYLLKILDYTKEAFKGLDDIVFRDKKYTVNKQLFKLYWCLESIKLFAADMESDVLLPILERATEEREYTIREKAAQILLNISDIKYLFLINKLKNDENYYVRAVFNKPCNIS